MYNYPSIFHGFASTDSTNCEKSQHFRSVVENLWICIGWLYALSYPIPYIKDLSICKFFGTRGWGARCPGTNASWILRDDWSFGEVKSYKRIFNCGGLALSTPSLSMSLLSCTNLIKRKDTFNQWVIQKTKTLKTWLYIPMLLTSHICILYYWLNMGEFFSLIKPIFQFLLYAYYFKGFKFQTLKHY